MGLKVCYIVSNVQKSLGFEWTALRLKDKYDLSFILLNPGPSPLEQFLIDNNIKVVRINYHGKRSFLTAFWKTWRTLKKWKPKVVHVHLLDAQLIGLTAARMLKIPKRIYTRHTSNFHHAYHPRGVRYDTFSNRRATHIISLSQATYFCLKTLEAVPGEKIRTIPHGFDFPVLTNVTTERVNSVRRKWNIPADRTIVGVIARHIEWKGIQYIVPAFQKLLATHPKAILVLANAAGPYHKKITGSLEPIRSSVVEIPFEEDIAALYATFSIYVHTPIDPVVEAFGQTYVEALAAGVPSVFTLSGIASEFAENEVNSLVVDFKNSDSIHAAMVRLLQDGALRDRLIKKGKEDVFSRFGIAKMIGQLEQLYEE